ncbi:MAG: type II toxin-antitoxin system RatA family toxin [Gammaproteobacteria bacterium]|nr:type II toxin-antitoxin system RatA family toxin [Gammaproteobacteria bacterium]
MPSIRRSALVPYSARQMFELVNDIESYPAFLPWCRRAQITSRQTGQVTATIQIAKGPVAKQFSTRNVLVQDQRIDMQLLDGPFRSLQGSWSFGEDRSGLCQVAFELDFEYSSALIATTLGPLFERAADRLVQSFCQRAAELY